MPLDEGSDPDEGTRVNRVRRLLRDLVGRNDAGFVTLLRTQIDVAVRACGILEQAIRPDADVASAAADLLALEARADRARESLIDELAVVLTTPLDREDLFRLSRALDDVVDNLNDFAETLRRFALPDASSCAPALVELANGLRALDEAVGALAQGPVGVPARARAAKHESRVRDAFLSGLLEVLDDPVDAGTLRRRELLRRLDVAGLRLGEACDVLADAALKRG